MVVLQEQDQVVKELSLKIISLNQHYINSLINSTSTITLTTMSSKNALIIMTKNPILGNCKTRLAATLGNEKALSIYIQLLDYTAHFSKNIEADRFIYSTEEVIEKERWVSPTSYFRIQSSGDLGERMSNAIQEILDLGYKKIVLIGSDCAEINSKDIYTAFQKLENHDITLGPALDGGYYLIGTKEVTPTLFQNISWSTNSVLKDTITKIEAAKMSYFLLKEKSDIDVEEDLKREGYIEFQLIIDNS